MQRSLFGACLAHTGLIKKLIRERQWDTGPANREPLCGPSCTFGQSFSFRLSHSMPFSAELPQGRQCYRLETVCQCCLQQQMLQKWPSLPDPRRGPSAGEGRTPHGSFSMVFPSQNTCLPRHDHLSVPWQWVDGKQGHPVLLRHSQSCLRATASTLSKPAAVSKPYPSETAIHAYVQR